MGGIIEIGIAVAVAVGEAAAAVTVADVALAVTVGGIGLSAAGAITHNKTLSTIGMAMGIAGGVMGIGGALLGVGEMTMGEAVSAAGDFFAGGEAAASTGASAVDAAAGASQEAMGQGIVASTNPEYAAATQVAGSQDALGQGIVAGTPAAPTPVQLNATGPVSGVSQADLGQQAVDGTLGNLQASQEMAGIQPAQAAPSAVATETPVASNQSQAAYEATKQAANAAPEGMSSAQGQQLVGALNGGGTPVASGAAPSTAADLWGKLPDWAKYSAVTSGIQGLTGLAAGYYQGLSAEERLNFDKMIEQNKQNQIQYLNKNNAYAPKVTFNKPAGALNTVR